MTRDELEDLARETASRSREKQRLRFQVRHPHYKPPPAAHVDFNEGWQIAMRCYEEHGQHYSRQFVWRTVTGMSTEELVDHYDD